MKTSLYDFPKRAGTPLALRDHLNSPCCQITHSHSYINLSQSSISAVLHNIVSKKGQRIQQLETKEFGSVRRARFQEMLGEMKQDHEDDIPEDQVEFAWIRSRSHPARQQETRAARLNSLPADEVVAHKVQDTERHAMDRANAAPEQNAEASAYNPTYYDNMISAMTLEDRGGSNRKAVAATQRYRRKNKDNPEY